MIVKGIPVGTTMPRPDWNQNDPRKADFIKNKPDIEKNFLKKSNVDDEGNWDVNMEGHRLKGLPIPQSATEPATKEFVENFNIEGSTYVATDDNKDGNIVLRPYVADVDELEFRGHIENNDNPHGVTLSQIGAAPAGYGLGEGHGRYCPDCNAFANGGLYYIDSATQNKPDGVSSGALVIHPIPSSNGADFYLTLKSGANIAHCYYSSWANAWQPWEWENPPMEMGVEYRTTERWNGKAVYTKLVNLGALPNAKEQIVPVDIQNLEYPLSVSVFATKGTWAFTLPSSYDSETTVMFNSNSVTISTTVDRSDYTGYATIKYTKN